MNDNVLVVAAHPDDEVLGCGATMARLADEGRSVYVMILGEGVTSRDESRDGQKRASDLEDLKVTARASNAVLGIKDVFFGDLPDNRFDSVPLLDVIKKVESVIDRVEPSLVFTHYEYDLNIDHKVTSLAVKTATRSIMGSPVRELLAFSVLSSTEWNYGANPYSPNVFFDISGYLDKKLDAMSLYEGELRDWPHPRSLKAIEHEARLRGCYVGCDGAEGFVGLRSIK
ncbi:MAG: PIG-L deacetylase family protein [Synergistota bacterium]|nr:PIG-L deacetylase family protein [Synergistota bacterium]